jgi:hypothetical protein
MEREGDHFYDGVSMAASVLIDYLYRAAAKHFLRFTLKYGSFMYQLLRIYSAEPHVFDHQKLHSDGRKANVPRMYAREQGVKYACT